MNGKRFQTGDVARETGVTVRAMLKEFHAPKAEAKLATVVRWIEADQQRVDGQYAALCTGEKAAVADELAPQSAAGQALAEQVRALIDVLMMGAPQVMDGMEKT